MGNCVWCGKESSSLIPYVDVLGDTYNICESCNETVVEGCECRKCGDTVDPLMMINGMCTNCIQAEITNKSRKQEEVRRRVGVDIISEMDNGEDSVELTDEDYEHWITFSNKYSKTDIMRSQELKRMWVLIKLNATGVYDNKVIGENFKDIEELLDRNFTKMIGKRCRIVIADTASARKMVRDNEVVDHSNKVYILKMDTLE